MTKEETRQKLVQAIQDVGEDLIRNAEEYVTDDDCEKMNQFGICIDIDILDLAYPTIQLLKTYRCDTTFERFIKTEVRDHSGCCGDACDLVFANGKEK